MKPLCKNRSPENSGDLSLSKKSLRTFLTALLPPSILPRAKCCYARKALKNQGFSVAGYCTTRRALPPRAPLLLCLSKLKHSFSTVSGLRRIPETSDCQKSLAEFFRPSEKINTIVFCGGVYVAENTSHGAKCRIVRPRRTTEAWSEVQTLFVKEGHAFFDKLKIGLRRIPETYFYYSAAGQSSSPATASTIFAGLFLGMTIVKWSRAPMAAKSAVYICPSPW